MSGATKSASNQAHGFAAWSHQTQLDDWRQILVQADADIAQLAREAGIDWKTLRQQLPPCGSLLKGNRVPVLSQRDRGRNAFIWHLNTSRQGNTWPCLVFMSFRHGGVHQIFHGYRWAWLRYQSGAPAPNHIEVHARPKLQVLENRELEQREARWRTERFRRSCQQWHDSTRPSVEHPLLIKRLCGHASPELLARLSLRAFSDRHGEGLMVRLLNHEHGHCGLQLLHEPPLDTCGRTQDLVIRQAGMKRGSFVCIHAAPGHEGWPVAICEGVFTALSVALGWPGPLAIALDAGNLAAVRRMIGRPCVLFADNDAWAAHNTGLLRARQATRPGDRVVLPHFTIAQTAQQPTDFNDPLHLSGHDELLRQLHATWPEQPQGDSSCPAS